LFKKWDSKINLKARLNRHLRIIKNNIWNNSVKIEKKQSKDFKMIIFIVILLIPIYPTLASYMYNNSRYDFYRWDIDESSIIQSYFWVWESEDWHSAPMLESMDSYLSVNTILDDERDLEWTNEIVDYEVQVWESFYSISYKFKVSTNSIYWANDFEKDHTLHPWDIIKVPPVTWLIHQVKSWDTVSSIAKKYEVEEEIIIEQNLMEEWSKLIAWEVLVIPWAIKKPDPKPIVVPKNSTVARANNTTWYWFANESTSQIVNETWRYQLVRRKPSWTFYWWNCTRYVAQYKNVTWWWNANQWIKNAKAKWISTWTQPTIWAIVQFNWRWYNPRYWHVWIVMDIVWSDIIVSDMNFRRLNEVTYRKVPINDRSIQWYIYVD
jgi:surface antigen/LysM repeat protein